MKILAIQNRMGIGDTVIFLPYIKAISQKFNSPISLLVKESSKADQYLNDTDYINEIIILDRNKNSKGVHDGILGSLNLIKELNLYLNSQNKILLIGFIKKYSPLDERITNFLSNNNINFVDITLGNEEKYTIPIDSHPNKLANITRAKLLSDFIKKNNLLKY